MTRFIVAQRPGLGNTYDIAVYYNDVDFDDTWRYFLEATPTKVKWENGHIPIYSPELEDSILQELNDFNDALVF